MGLFAGLPADVLEDIERRLPCVSWGRQDPAPPALARMEHLYLVRAGRVALLGALEPSGSVMVALLAPGMVYSTIQTVDAPSALPLEDEVAVSPIPAPAVARMIAHFPRFGMDLVGALSERASLHRETIALMSHLRVEDRLLGRIRQLAAEFGVVTPRGLELRLDLTHAQWSKLVGASREATTVSFGRLRDAGRLAVDGRVILLPLTPATEEPAALLR
jgi:CRP/FNR family transcriptional regulator